MKKYELSKYDFDKLEQILNHWLITGVIDSRAEQLRDKFAKADTGWLEMEDE